MNIFLFVGLTLFNFLIVEPLIIYFEIKFSPDLFYALHGVDVKYALEKNKNKYKEDKNEKRY